MAQPDLAATSARPAQDERLRRSSPLRNVLGRPELGAIFGAVAIWIYFAIVAGDSGFLSLGGTATYLEVAAELGILAVAVALLMIAGEFDLSVGSMIGASGMIMALLAVEYGWTLWLAALAALGFALHVDEWPTRFVLRDPDDRRIDFHPVTFGADGAATQELYDGSLCPYPAEGFTGRGTVGGRPVRCLSAAVQVLHHQGYEPQDKDHHDLRLLRDRFRPMGTKGRRARAD